MPGNTGFKMIASLRREVPDSLKQGKLLASSHRSHPCALPRCPNLAPQTQYMVPGGETGEDSVENEGGDAC